MVCFDKTGTLTEDGLDVLGVRVVEGNGGRNFGDLCTTVTDLLPQDSNSADSLSSKNRLALLHTMATCHTLRVIDNELLGDPLDQKMFSFTEWKYSEGERKKRESSEAPNLFGRDDGPRTTLSPPVAWPPVSQLPKNTIVENEDVSQDSSSERQFPLLTLPPKDPNLKLGVHRQFEFVSQLRRASVIVKHFGAQGGHVFVKGAPECMSDICNPDSCMLPSPIKGPMLILGQSQKTTKTSSLTTPTAAIASLPAPQSFTPSSPG